MKNLKLLDYLIWIIIAGTLVSAIYFYSILPDQVATHWNAAGEVDGWGSKTMGAFIAPIIMIAMYVLFIFLPRLDPKKENYQNFKGVYKGFQLLLIAFLAAMHFITNGVNLGYNLSIDKLMPILVGVLFIVIAFFLKNIKPNWFIGIRTPWTLSNDQVWKKTHQFASKIFILIGILFILFSYLKVSLWPWLMIFLLALIVLIFLYSYLEYRKIGDK